MPADAMNPISKPVTRTKIAEGVYAISAESAPSSARDAIREEMRKLGEAVWRQADEQARAATQAARKQSRSRAKRPKRGARATSRVGR
jgi:hypothetical protein